MDTDENIKLSTWGSLWKWFGIQRNAWYGFYYMVLSGKIADVRDWCYYWIGFNKYKPPLLGETEEDFYIRKIYSTTYDGFNRPLMGPASTHITIGLRKEVPIEYSHHLVLVPGKTKEAINFGSYNYLGYGGPHPIINKELIKTVKNNKTTVSGFACEKGVSEEQKNLEKMLAEFLHKEEAIIVPMGFATNSTLIPILVGKGDVVFSDALNHCSMIVGMKSSNAEIKVFKHNDMNDLKKKLEDLKKNGMKNGQQPKKVLVVVEGLYSMEGEFCKLKEIIALKKAYGFYLYVDEAHSIGALGQTGRGIVEHLGCDFNDVDILMGTFSKSFASAGGYLASDKKTIALLKSNCYSYVYGSPISPVEAQQISTCLRLIQSEDGKKRIAQLRKSSITLRKKFKEAGCHVLGDYDSPVIPVMIYHEAKAGDITRICLKNGIAIVLVGYPACPFNTTRIRFCVSGAHTDEDIEKCFNVTYNGLKEIGSVYGDTPIPSFIYRPPEVNIDELNNLPKEPRKMPPLWESSDKRIIKSDPLPPIGLDLVSYDIYDFEQNKSRQNEIIKTINTFGCGSCGPRAFYGTTIEHLNLEEKLKKLYDVNDAVVYSYGNNTMTSVVNVYGKRGFVILVDEYCNYPIQLGCRLGRAKVIKFKHNDVEDLKEKLVEAKKQLSYHGIITIVTEGVFQHDLSFAPLKELSKLRASNVYLIVDDSLGFGVLGVNLKGSIEHQGLTMNDIDIYCASLEFICNAVGGFIVGKYSIIDKQRLFGVGYTFSASAPPFTCTAASFSFEELEKNCSGKRNKIIEKRNKLVKLINEKAKNVEVIGNENLPYVYLNYEGKNETIVCKLREKEIFVCLQQHLEEDWCQNNYVRFNVTEEFSNEKMNQFAQVISTI